MKVFRGGGAGQFPEEIAWLAERLAGAQFLLEIGSWRGGSLGALMAAMPSHAKIYSVDLPRNDDDLAALVHTCEELGVQRITGNSHSALSVKRMLELTAGSPLDVLFIDGDHSYRGVAADFEDYSTMVKDGGLIAFHDIADHKCPGVVKYWGEVSKRYAHETFVLHPQRKGIGVLRYAAS